MRVNACPPNDLEALRGAWQDALQEVSARDPCLRTQAWAGNPTQSILGVGATGEGLQPCLFVATEADVPAARRFAQSFVDGAVKIRVTGEMAAQPAPPPATSQGALHPLTGGAPLSRLDQGRATVATLGCILPDTRGRPMALSNMHFLAPTKGTAGAPSDLKVWAGPQGPVVAQVERWQQVTSQWKSWPNRMDAGVARLEEDVGPPQIGHIATLGRISGTGVAMPGDVVHKRGATTGTTRGRVVSIMVSRRIQYSWAGQEGAEFVLSDCTEVANTDLGGAGAFSRPGDSGSAIVTPDGAGQVSLVGLHFAGSATSAMYCPIEPVLETFALTIPREA